MAEKRMFTQKIIDSDAFLDMPLSAQSLYFHLNMRADDDGFINNPRKIGRMIGASDDDLRLLLAKRFILGFESGVIVIKHWRMHNTLRKDRYSPTLYQEEFDTLLLKDNGAYTDARQIVSNMDTECIPLGNQMATTWQPNGNHLATQNRIDKNRLDIKEKEIYKEKEKNQFIKPTIAEIDAYIKEKGYTFSADKFFNFYEAKDWMIGKNKMKNWKACCNTWENKQIPSKKVRISDINEREYEKGKIDLDLNDPTAMF